MRKKRWSLLRFLMVYFAGAISMLVFLTPGKIPLKDLFNRDRLSHLADFDHAADKIENISDLAGLYSSKAYHYISEKTDCEKFAKYSEDRSFAYSMGVLQGMALALGVGLDQIVTEAGKLPQK